MREQLGKIIPCEDPTQSVRQRLRPYLQTQRLSVMETVFKVQAQKSKLERAVNFARVLLIPIRHQEFWSFYLVLVGRTCMCQYTRIYGWV